MTWIDVVERWLSAGAEYRSRTDEALAGMSCVYCGDPAQTLDHIVPRSKGGPDEPSNLVPACRRCNGAKSAMSLEEWATALRADIARIERKRVQLRSLEKLQDWRGEPVVSSCIHDWQEIEINKYRCGHCGRLWAWAA
jgi:hypothetical protein